MRHTQSRRRAVLRQRVLSGLLGVSLALTLAANWPSTSGTTTPGVVLEDGAGNKIGTSGSPVIVNLAGAPNFAALNTTSGTAQIAAGGTGFASGNAFHNVSTGIVGIVTGVSGGVVTSINLTSLGSTTLPPTNPVAMTATTGVGVGLTLNVLWGPITSGFDFSPMAIGSGLAEGTMFVGYNAGLGRDGINNLATMGFGFGAAGSGNNNSDGLGTTTGLTGGEHTLFGYAAGSQLTSANNATAFGVQALSHETTGSGNTAIGQDNSKWVNGGSNITSVGSNTTKNLQNASNIVAVGDLSLQGNQYVSNITAVADNGSGKPRLTLQTALNAALVSNQGRVAITGTFGTTAITTGSPYTTFTIVDTTHVDLPGVTLGSTTVSGGVFNLFPATPTSIVALGHNVMSNPLLTTAANMVVIGKDTGNLISSATTGVVIGTSAAAALTTSTQDVIVGWNSAAGLTTGTNNTIIGSSSGGAVLTTGTQNTIIGANAQVTTNSNDAVLIGSGSARAAGASVIIGSKAGNASLTGAFNTVIGYQAGAATLTTGTNNLLLGVNNNVDTAAAASTHALVIGTNASLTAASNAINIEGVLTITGTNNPPTSGASYAGTLAIAGITTDATHTDSSVCQDTTTHVLYAGSGAAGICLGTSSERFKHEVAALPPMIGSKLLDLQPISYHYNEGYGDPAKKLYGFTAEQVQTVLPELVGLDTEGRPNSVDWAGLVPVIVSQLQAQQQQITALRKQLNAH